MEVFIEKSEIHCSYFAVSVDCIITLIKLLTIERTFTFVWFIYIVCVKYI